MPKPISCESCPLHAEEGPVFGEGPKTARLVILGQSPGTNEIKEKRPFVGTSGQLLNRTLQKVGISRANSYVTNTVKCYVKPGVTVPPAAVRHCSSTILKPELASISEAGGGAVVLTLGQEAFDSLCSPKHVAIIHVRAAAKKDPSYWLVGAPFHHPSGYVVVPAMHPTFVALTGFTITPKFENQIAQAAAVLDWGAPTELQLKYNYNPTDAEVIEYAELCGQQLDIGVDIETPEKIDEDEQDAEFSTPISLIGLAANDRDCMGISPDQFHLLTDFFTRTRNTTTCMWTYSGFDLGHLTNLYGTLKGVQPADAMIAFHLLHPDERSKDLGTCMAMYTRWGYHKNLERRNPILYNTLDTVGCLEAGVKMFGELGDFPIDMRPLFWMLNEIQLDLQKWQNVGAPYDQHASDIFELKVGMALQGYEKFWREKFPYTDHASPKQLVPFFEKLGFKPPLKNRVRKDKTKYKSASVDEEVLQSFADKGSAVAKLLILMRQLKKSDEFCNQAERGRLRTRAKIHGQAGGRIQTVNKNIQQIPEEMLVKYDENKQPIEGSGIYPRECVVTEHEDDCVVAADFSQIEFWLYAYFSRCQKLLDIKNRGEYLYGDFYEAVWNEPFFLPGKPRFKGFRDESITPPWKLLVAKSWPLGFIYGRGVPGVEGLPILPTKAKQIRADFFKSYPEISAYHNKIMFDATKQGFLQTPFGRMRRFSNPQAQRNSLLAFPGQSTAPDILVQKVIHEAGRRIRALFGERSRLYFTVHDSGIFNIHGGRDPKVAAAAVEFIKNCMESPIPELDGFSIPCEVKVGPSWGQTMSAEKYATFASSAT